MTAATQEAPAAPAAPAAPDLTPDDLALIDLLSSLDDVPLCESIPCQRSGAPNPATWRGVLRPCGCAVLACDACHQGTVVEMSKKRWRCTNHEPTVRIERVDWLPL
jgi:hypothetical protein